MRTMPWLVSVSWLDGLAARGRVERWPAAAGVVLRLGLEQLGAAAGAAVDAVGEDVVVLAGECPLGALLAQHAVLLGGQLLPPLLLGLLNLGHLPPRRCLGSVSRTAWVLRAENPPSGVGTDRRGCASVCVGRGLAGQGAAAFPADSTSPSSSGGAQMGASAFCAVSAGPTRRAPEREDPPSRASRRARRRGRRATLRRRGPRGARAAPPRAGRRSAAPARRSRRGRRRPSRPRAGASAVTGTATSGSATPAMNTTKADPHVAPGAARQRRARGSPRCRTCPEQPGARVGFTVQRRGLRLGPGTN